MFDLPRYLFITVAVGDDSHYTLQIERTGNRYKVVNFQSVFRYVVNGKLVLKKRNGNGKDIGVESIVLKEK
nr:unknown [Medicago truncatula]